MIFAYVVAKTADEALERLLTGAHYRSYSEAEDNIFDSKQKVYSFPFAFRVE